MQTTENPNASPMTPSQPVNLSRAVEVAEYLSSKDRHAIRDILRGRTVSLHDAHRLAQHGIIDAETVKAPPRPTFPFALDATSPKAQNYQLNLQRAKELWGILPSDVRADVQDILLSNAKPSSRSNLVAYGLITVPPGEDYNALHQGKVTSDYMEDQDDEDGETDDEA